MYLLCECSQGEDEAGRKERLPSYRLVTDTRGWNAQELMHTIAGFSGVIRPMVYVTGKGSSVTIVERKERVIRLVS